MGVRKQTKSYGIHVADRAHLPVCPIIGGGEGSLISGNFGGESWKVRLQDSPLDADPAGEMERQSVSLKSSGDFLKFDNQNMISIY